jgi:16S rRNA (cytidine1402-2'-O)-methyltransferase
MSAPSTGTGELFLVATPIGNLDDLSQRARSALSVADLVLAEDTRRTGRLLARLGVERPLMSLHEHNERTRIASILARLEAGDRIALVSDAGTPLISDPGYELVRAAIERNLRVLALPGPCAAIVALTVSGLPADRFVFEGFLPSRESARRARLELLARELRSIVFYEAPHRLADALADLASIFGGERRAAIARELTKLHETLYHGSLDDLAERATQDPDMLRGEIVIVVAGADTAGPAVPEDAERIVKVLVAEMSPAQAAKLASRITGASRAMLYEIACRLAPRASDR